MRFTHKLINQKENAQFIINTNTHLQKYEKSKRIFHTNTKESLVFLSYLFVLKYSKYKELKTNKNEN